jgi:hypothetical protein
VLGKKIELEHHLGKKMALKIARDPVKEDPCPVKEDPCYELYRHLIAMEKKYKTWF